VHLLDVPGREERRTSVPIELFTQVMQTVIGGSRLHRPRKHNARL
jgi:hypothetical protein